eukprot:UN28330
MPASRSIRKINFLCIKKSNQKTQGYRHYSWKVAIFCFLLHTVFFECSDSPITGMISNMYKLIIRCLECIIRTFYM